MTVELEQQINPVVEHALTKCSDITTLPEVTAKIIQLVEDRDSTARDMHEVIRTDPALSARVLKVVNSAFYGLPGQVASVDRATVLLGLSAVKNIAIAASISRMFNAQQVGAEFTAKDIWKHSVAVGVAGRMIAKRSGFPVAADEVFLAGLIHDIGLMVARQAYPEKLTETVEQAVAGRGSFLELEEKIIGANHQAFGDRLVSKWKFPRNLRAMVGLHHHPERMADELKPFGAIIRAADLICCQNRIGFHLTAADTEPTDEVLETVQLSSESLPEFVEELHEHIAIAESTLAAG